MYTEQMYDAQPITPATTVYGPWIERKADNIIFTVDVIEIQDVANAQITFRLFTKNLEATTDGDEVDSTVKIERTTEGREDAQWGPDTGTGLKELVRYECKAEVGFSNFRVLEPVWFNTIRA